MNKNEIIEKLKDIFLNVINSNINFDNLNDNTDIMLDLGVDSIGLIYLAVAIEKEFKVDLTNITTSTFKTFGDVVNFISNEQNK